MHIWSYINVHVVMYPCGCSSALLCMWLCIHMYSPVHQESTWNLLDPKSFPPILRLLIPLLIGMSNCFTPASPPPPGLRLPMTPCSAPCDEIGNVTAPPQSPLPLTTQSPSPPGTPHDDVMMKLLHHSLHSPPSLSPTVNPFERSLMTLVRKLLHPSLLSSFSACDNCWPPLGALGPHNCPPPLPS